MIFFFIVHILWMSSSWASANQLVRIPQGEVRVLYLNKAKPVSVASFQILQMPVSVKDFLQFLKEHPKWQRSQLAKSLFADAAYLSIWHGDLNPGEISDDTAVTQVSWFSARAYCESKGLALPSVQQWERAGQGQVKGVDITQKILEWYGQPTSAKLARISSGLRNQWGVLALHGLIWEWTEDFNSVFVTGESRGDGAIEKNLFCGAGAESGGDPTDYAAFMRFAYRASLKANYSIKNLGFRCVRGDI